MKREMVEVTLYENGKYTVEDIPSHYATQRLWGSSDGMHIDIYHCPKKNWKKYLLKLTSTTDIDKQIAKLKKRKQKILEIRERLTIEVRDEVNH